MWKAKAIEALEAIIIAVIFTALLLSPWFIRDPAVITAEQHSEMLNAQQAGLGDEVIECYTAATDAM